MCLNFLVVIRYKLSRYIINIPFNEFVFKLVFTGISKSAETYHKSRTEETNGARIFCGKSNLTIWTRNDEEFSQELDKTAKERDQRRNKHKEKHKKKKKKKKHYRSESEESDSESDIDYLD